MVAIPSDLLIQGQRFSADSAGLSAAVASAYDLGHRPRCLCTAAGAEMYIARMGDSYFVKRMPGTGSQHIPLCPSYEPPAELSGLGEVLGTAIVEDPDSGRTHLRLGFSMSQRLMSPPVHSSDPVTCSAKAAGTRLSLRGLLHYLWEQAELTRWQPA